MTSLAATVLIPTFDHGPTVAFPIRSALAQSVSDIEVFVVGDGAPDATRELVESFSRRDARVRWFGFPKGDRHGEAYRHEVLQNARGRIVAYLADDDFWLPDHLGRLTTLLDGADFAHTLPIWVDPAGGIGSWPVDLERPVYRRLLGEYLNRVPLGCAGHTRELYRRLPHGWRPAPPKSPSDVWMWAQILDLPGVRARSGTAPSLIHFPSWQRKKMTGEERLVELERWERKLGTEPGRKEFQASLFESIVRDRIRIDEGVTRWRRSFPGRVVRKLSRKPPKR